MRFGRILLTAGVLVLPVLPSSAHAATSSSLSGRFAVGAGACNGPPSGSYFRMILPTGGADGPFVSNNDSVCADKTYTPLTPGHGEGGLVVGTYQPEPTPAFDGKGNSLADRITLPTPFEGINFSTSTNGTDPQTTTPVPPPSLSVADDGTLSGDLRSFGTSWNYQEFNQGAPKPDGSSPGLTAAPAGTLDSQSGAFTLEWRSQIVGGPFDRFTGLWHLEGTFTSDSRPTTAVSPPPSDQQSVGSTDQQGSSAVALASTTSTSTSLAPASTSASSTASGRAALPSTATSPGVVVARSGGGGSSGKGWLAVPAALGAVAVGGLALRYRMLNRKDEAS